jgi:hypothetical protein
MDAQELRNLQEAYLEVVIGEGKVEWDNPKRHLPSGLTPREKNRAKRISTGVENPNIKPSEKKLERYGKLKIAHDDEKGKKVPRNKRHHFSQFDTGPFVSDPVSKRREQKNKLKDLKELVKEDFDLYDIILSHLLDEGYAETPEAAEAIMVNMSEDWREDIVEAKVDEKLPEHERSGARLKRYDNPSGALALGGGQQRARRAEHEERRGKKK